MIIEINNKEDLLNLSIKKPSFVEFNFDTNPYNKYLIYVKSNSIVGFMCYEHIFDRFELDNITVVEHNRKTGIGSCLMEHLIELGKKYKVNNITLEVNKNNSIAINLYKKYGFVEKAIRKNYYNGVDGILMERKMM